DVVKLLTRIDRPARSVEMEVTLVEVAAKADAPGLPSGAELLAKLDDLSKSGAAVQRIKLTAIEGQPVSVQTGGNKPYASSSTVTGRGPGGGGLGGGNPALGLGGPVSQRSVMYHQVGTTVKASAHIEGDGAIAVELNVQDAT